jgi:transposase
VEADKFQLKMSLLKRNLEPERQLWRLMMIPGVGPVVALTYRATVDVPARFRKSKAVGAVFGLTCSKYQSGEIDRSGRISRCGDEMMRVMLYEAAQSMLIRQLMICSRPAAAVNIGL